MFVVDAQLLVLTLRRKKMKMQNEGLFMTFAQLVDFGCKSFAYKPSDYRGGDTDDLEAFCFWHIVRSAFLRLRREDQEEYLKLQIARDELYRSTCHAQKEWATFWGPFLGELLASFDIPKDCVHATVLQELLKHGVPQDRNLWDAVLNVVAQAPAA